MEDKSRKEGVDVSVADTFLTMPGVSNALSVVPSLYKISTLGKRARDLSIYQDLGPQKKKTKLSSPVTISQANRSAEKQIYYDTQYTTNKPHTLLSIAYRASQHSSPNADSSYFSKRVAYLLNTLCKINSTCTEKSVAASSIFFKTAEGPGEVQQLVDTIEERNMDSVIILTTALILLDRVQRAGTPVYRETVVRLFATCALVAIKVHREGPARNCDLIWLFAKQREKVKHAFKLKRLLRTIRQLEVELLKKLQWRIFIASVTYRRYQEAIMEFFL